MNDRGGMHSDTETGIVPVNVYRMGSSFTFISRRLTLC
ncbi:MAG: hypothetical protein A4E60_02112 [Syntrophorhabdus sp. PtaB.Bin047]|nr:MAG: hypothetical protein A4E60_02112 [Syntrophorhabdus sp. PtaB.Bin047]